MIVSPANYVYYVRYVTDEDVAYGDLNLFCTCPPVEDTTGGDLSSTQES